MCCLFPLRIGATTRSMNTIVIPAARISFSSWTPSRGSSGRAKRSRFGMNRCETDGSRLISALRASRPFRLRRLPLTSKSRNRSPSANLPSQIIDLIWAGVPRNVTSYLLAWSMAHSTYLARVISCLPPESRVWKRPRPRVDRFMIVHPRRYLSAVCSGSSTRIRQARPQADHRRPALMRFRHQSSLRPATRSAAPRQDSPSATARGE